MRRMNQRELNLINSDLGPMEHFFRINGLENESYIEKYNRNLSIMAMTQQELGGANGITKGNNGKITIGLSENIFSDDKKRARTLYHELGHALMGLKYSNESVKENILNRIVKIKNENEATLREECGVYLDGLTLLEEYLVEKFSAVMMYMAKGIPEPPKVSLRTPPISGNYSYYATFQSNYGIFESLGDKIVVKTFGNLTNTIKYGLAEKYFTTFFEKYNNVELMKILGNFGHVKRAIYAHAGQNQYQYNPEQIHQILNSTNVMIDGLAVAINPNRISNLGRTAIQHFPGEMSRGTQDSQNIFSRELGRDENHRRR